MKSEKQILYLIQKNIATFHISTFNPPFSTLFYSPHEMSPSRLIATTLVTLIVIVSSVFSIPEVSAQTAAKAKGNPNFRTMLQDVVTTNEGGSNFQGKSGGIKQYFQELTTQPGGEGISDFIVDLIAKILVPIFVLVGIFFAILGFFKLMASTDEKELQT